MPKKETGLDTSWVDLTPEMAAALLERRVTNRAVSSARVSRIARDIKTGKWRVNGEAIKCDKRGRMIDGQHRCSAVVITQKTIKTMLVRGLDEIDIRTVDVGKPRSMSDVLKIHGEKNCTALAALIGLVYQWNAGRIGNRGRMEFFPTCDEAFALLKQDPALRDSVNTGAVWDGPVRKAPYFFLYHITRATNPEMADEFWGRVSDGVGLQTTDPAYRLRSKLMDIHFGNVKPTQRDRLIYGVKAWNAHFRGEKIRQLFVRKSEVGLPVVAGTFNPKVVVEGGDA